MRHKILPLSPFLAPERKKHKNILLRAELEIALTSLLLILYSFIRGAFVDAALDGAPARMRTLSLLLVLLVIFKCESFYRYSALFRKYKVLSLMDLRRRFFRSLLRRSVPAFRENSSGEYFALYDRQVERIGMEYFGSWYGSQQIFFEILFALLSLLWIRPQLALTGLLLLVPGLFIPRMSRTESGKRAKDAMQAENRMIAVFRDLEGAFSLMDAYGAENAFEARMEKETEDSCRAKLARSRFQWLVIESASFLTKLIQLLVIGYMALLLEKGELSIAALVSAAGLFENLGKNSFYVGSYVHFFISARTPLEAVESAILEGEAEEELPQEPVPDKIDVTFDAVGFGFEEERPLFKELSFQAASPGLVLIEGESGCGKSTAMNLLLGYYEPQEGRILVNGKDPRRFRSSMSVLRQEALFLEDSLENNLYLYGKKDPETLERLLDELGLEKFKDPARLAAPLGQACSGGEARRLDMARLALHPAPLIILDEPLANLDPLSVEKVTDEILRLKEEHLVFLVTHRVPEALAEAADERLRLAGAQSAV